MNSLTKHTISDCLLDEIGSKSLLHELLSSEFNSIDQVELAIGKIKERSTTLDKDLANDILEELCEIKDDLKWLLTPASEIIIAVNENYNNWQEKVSSQYDISDLMIRAHVGGKGLATLGTLDNPDDAQAITKYIEKISGCKVVLNKIV